MRSVEDALAKPNSGISLNEKQYDHTTEVLVVLQLAGNKNDELSIQRQSHYTRDIKVQSKTLLPISQGKFINPASYSGSRVPHNQATVAYPKDHEPLYP